MTMEYVSVPYVTVIQSSGIPKVGDAGRARVPVGTDIQKLGGFLRTQLEKLHPEAFGRDFRFSWYGSGALLESLSGRTLRSMSDHLLVAVEKHQAIDLDDIYALAAHAVGDTITSLRRGAPQRSVFVIHGHDEKSLQKLAAFLEANDCVPLILSRMPRQGGETVVEALERLLPTAALIVALFTEDDEGRARADSGRALRSRARQNVLVEAGYATIYRRADSLIIALGDVEMPSDFEGILTVRAKEWGFRVENHLADFVATRL